MLLILTPSSICLVRVSLKWPVGCILNLGFWLGWCIVECLAITLFSLDLRKCSLALVCSVLLVSPWYKLILLLFRQSMYCISYPVPPFVVFLQTSFLLVSEQQTGHSLFPQSFSSCGEDLHNMDRRLADLSQPYTYSLVIQANTSSRQL